MHQRIETKPQQRWSEVQFTTSMGEHHHEESEGRQAEEKGRGSSHTKSPTSPRASELKKVT